MSKISNRLLISMLGLALTATPALAKKVPLVSGKYASNYNQTCQGLQTSAYPGSTFQSVMITDFDSAAGTATLLGASSSGGLVIWTGAAEGMTNLPVNKSVVYSNTATTFTSDGVVYNAVYGPVKNGIAQTLMLSGQPFPDCVVSIILIHQ